MPAQPNPNAKPGAVEAAQLIRGGMGRGAAYQQVADKYGVKPRAIRQWIQNAGIKLPAPGAGNPKLQDFNDERRLKAGNRLADVLEARIGQIENLIAAGKQVPSREIRELTIAFGVLTDKRRLEDGEATDRTEQSVVPAREIVEAKILDLAERRKQRGLEIVDDD